MFPVICFLVIFGRIWQNNQIINGSGKKFMENMKKRLYTDLHIIYNLSTLCYHTIIGKEKR